MTAWRQNRIRIKRRRLPNSRNWVAGSVLMKKLQASQSFLWAYIGSPMRDWRNREFDYPATTGAYANQCYRCRIGAPQGLDRTSKAEPLCDTGHRCRVGEPHGVNASNT